MKLPFCLRRHLSVSLLPFY